MLQNSYTSYLQCATCRIKPAGNLLLAFNQEKPKPVDDSDDIHENNASSGDVSNRTTESANTNTKEEEENLTSNKSLLSMLNRMQKNIQDNKNEIMYQKQEANDESEYEKEKLSRETTKTETLTEVEMTTVEINSSVEPISDK